MGEPLPSHNFHHSVTFILPLSQNRHSTHRSVTFILPSCQNSHRTHIVMKKSIRFLIYIISNPNQTCNKHKMNILWTPYEITPYIGYFFYHYTILILEIKLIFVLCRMCLWRTHTACTWVAIVVHPDCGSVLDECRYKFWGLYRLKLNNWRNIFEL